MSEDTTLREALENVVTAAREIDQVFGGEPGRWTLDRKVVREPLASALLSMHDYLNDVTNARAALVAASQEREPQWEYRAVSGPLRSRTAKSKAEAERLLDTIRFYPSSCIERRVKAGEWQRIDDEPHG